MRKRFWTIRKNKYKHKSRKHNKHKKIKYTTRKIHGGTLPFSEVGSLSSIIGTFQNPFSTNIPASGNVVSTPYVWNQMTTVPGSKGL